MPGAPPNTASMHGRVGLDVGRHHDDVGGRQVGMLLEEPEQLVVQHLDLAHRAVAHVHLERAVVAGAMAIRPARSRSVSRSVCSACRRESSPGST